MTPEEEREAVREFVRALRRAQVATDHLDLLRSHPGQTTPEALAQAERLELEAIDALLEWLGEPPPDAV